MNQYTSRTLPGGVDVIGTANASSTVTVNDQPTYRKGEYFWRELAIGNEWVPVYQSITNLAVLNDSPNPDIVTNRVGHVLLSKTPETFLHDDDGNLVRDGLWTNIWNGENRLVRTESLSTVPESARARVDWTYLPDGRWIERIVSTWVGGSYVPQSTNRFVWDGHVLLGILDENNAVTLSFMRGLDLSGSMQGAGGVGGLLAVTDHSATDTHFVGNDGNGNVILLVSAANGEESGRYGYSPFGETIRITGHAAKANPIRFSTQLSDVTGDSKYLFREYRPATGGWLSRDPIGERGGKNLYCMVHNDPVNFFDPFGLTEANCCCKITLIIEVPARNTRGKLNRKGLAGHTGIGVDGEYYDYGPQPGGGSNPFGSPGRPWWDADTDINPSGNASLQDILDNIADLSGQNDTYKVTAEVNQSECDKVKQYWENLYNDPGTYRFYGQQCTTTACRSLREAGLIGGRALKPASFLKHVQKNLKHTCGDKKGQPADVERIHDGSNPAPTPPPVFNVPPLSLTPQTP